MSEIQLQDCVLCLPVRVDLCRVEAEDLLGDTNDSRESFVDFKSCDVLDGQVSLFKSDRESDGGCNGEIDRLDTGIGVGYKLL